MGNHVSRAGYLFYCGATAARNGELLEFTQARINPNAVSLSGETHWAWYNLYYKVLITHAE